MAVDIGSNYRNLHVLLLNFILILDINRILLYDENYNMTLFTIFFLLEILSLLFGPSITINILILVSCKLTIIQVRK